MDVATAGRGLRRRCTTSYLMPWLGSALLIGSRILADKAKDARVYSLSGPQSIVRGFLMGFFKGFLKGFLKDSLQSSLQAKKLLARLP